MDDLSVEYARVVSGPTEFEIVGSVVASEQGAPLRVEYRILCDPDWRTRQVEITQRHFGRDRTLRLDHDGEGQWRVNGEDAPALAGCTDVDLGLSPSTNALPINRLRLNRDEEGAIRAAWVRFPSLEIIPARQVYVRLDEKSYSYRSLASNFEAVIEVDEDGFTTNYSGVWQRVAEAPAGPPAPAASFQQALIASGPVRIDGPETADFGRVIGEWCLDVIYYDECGEIRARQAGKWSFGWVLDGKAVADVWDVPPASAPEDGASPLGGYGLTLRFYDETLGAWRSTWHCPDKGVVWPFVARRIEEEIVLERTEGGQIIRWIFSQITDASFHWRAVTSSDEGASWRLQQEMFATRDC